jgi:hypothetical protein
VIAVFARLHQGPAAPSRLRCAVSGIQIDAVGRPAAGHSVDPAAWPPFDPYALV